VAAEGPSGGRRTRHLASVSRGCAWAAKGAAWGRDETRTCQVQRRHVGAGWPPGAERWAEDQAPGLRERGCAWAAKGAATGKRGGVTRLLATGGKAHRHLCADKPLAPEYLGRIIRLLCLASDMRGMELLRSLQWKFATEVLRWRGRKGSKSSKGRANYDKH
jgi:hypothetical protein